MRIWGYNEIFSLYRCPDFQVSWIVGLTVFNFKGMSHMIHCVFDINVVNPRNVQSYSPRVKTILMHLIIKVAFVIFPVLCMDL